MNDRGGGQGGRVTKKQLGIAALVLVVPALVGAWYLLNRYQTGKAARRRLAELDQDETWQIGGHGGL